MKIWHEDIVPKLCKRHLSLAYRDAASVYEIVVEKKRHQYDKANVAEFKNCPMEIAFRLYVIHDELHKRGVNLGLPPFPFDISDVPFTQAIREGKIYVPWQTKKNQEFILKHKCKSCLVN